MKFFRAMAALCGVLVAGVNASAADLKSPVYKARPSAPVYSWDGFYAGVVVGAGVNNTLFDDKNCDLSCSSLNLNGSGVTAGGTLGWNYQFGRGVVGIEGDLSWSNFKKSFTDPDWPSHHSTNWEAFGTLRGRAGIAVDRVLMYATGGIAFVKLNAFGQSHPEGCPAFNDCFGENAWRAGIAAGGGVEYALAGPWSAKAEYLYVGLPSKRYQDVHSANSTDTFAIKSDTHMVRLGLNYRFGGEQAYASANGADAMAAMGPAANWTGFYVGAVAGAGVQNTIIDDKDCNLSCSSQNMNGSGVSAGGTVGWNQQFGHGLLGVEADFSWANFKDSFTDPDWQTNGSIHNAEWKWFSTVRGRGGLVVGNALIYATGGVAFVDTKVTGTNALGACDSQGCFDISGVKTGIAAGFGAEYALGGSWSAKAEYLYVGLPSKDGHDLVRPRTFDIYNAKSDAHLVRLGLNYHVNPIGTVSDVPALQLAQWNGFYVGIAAGGGLQNTAINDKNCNLSCSTQNLNGSGFTEGATVGWNHQFGAGVVGVEADLNWANFKDSFTDPSWPSTHSAEWKWFSTVRGRAGLVVDRAFVYATGGLALVDVDDFGHSASGNCDNTGCFSVTGVKTGVAAGFGAEYALAGPWSAKAEYLYIGLPSKNTRDLVLTTASDTYNVKSDAHIVRLGVNYHLN